MGSRGVDALVRWEIQDLLELLAPEVSRTGAWAEAVCVQTRDVHFAVWFNDPSYALVSDDVIPLFEEAQGHVAGVPPSEDYRTDVYVRNIQARTANLHGYVRGEPSVINPPSDPLEDPSPTKAPGRPE